MSKSTKEWLFSTVALVVMTTIAIAAIWVCMSYEAR